MGCGDLFLLILLLLIAALNNTYCVDQLGLYSESDHVTLLTSRNLGAEIYEKEYAQLVQFYNSSNPRCIVFAPEFKKLSRAITHWKPAFRLAVFDCYEEVNNQLCEYITKKNRPQLFRYVHENYTGDYGIPVNIKRFKTERLKNAIISQMKEEQKQGRLQMVPSLAIANYTSIDKALYDVPKNQFYTFLIYENPSSNMGSEIILDTMDYNRVTVKRVDKASQSANELGLQTFPCLAAIGRKKDIQFVTPVNATKRKILNALNSLLTAKGYIVPYRDTDNKEVIVTTVMNNEDIVTTTVINSKEDIITDVNNLQDIVTDTIRLEDIVTTHINNHEVIVTTLPSTTHNINLNTDLVFYSDLETTLRTLLKTEITKYKTLTSKSHNALLKFVEAIRDNFPYLDNARLRSFLQALVVNLEPAVIYTGKDIYKLVKSLEEEHNPYRTSGYNYVGCKGSQPQYRGFTCGLWVLFHSLTVGAASKRNNEGPKVLQAIHGYVKYFFGCIYCVKQFLAMAARNRMFHVSDNHEAVFWLWKAHNEMNLILSGAMSEDPQYPKIQFPTKARCPGCLKTSHMWHLPGVYHYLQTMYGDGLRGSPLASNNTELFLF